MFFLRDDFKKHLNADKDLFDQVMEIDGERFRELENRRTLRFKLGKKVYFIKQHFGVGWKEIFKNLFQLRLPVVSARNEWTAIRLLSSLRLPSMSLVGYGERGFNPAKRQSFIITNELKDMTSLEELVLDWDKNPPTIAFKRRLIEEVAMIVRTMHQAGMNHRDCYICHFLIRNKDIEHLDDKRLHLYLIDLHRAQIRKFVPRRWQIKDLSGILFSTYDVPLTERDHYRFLQHYFQQPLRAILKKRRRLLKAVNRRAIKLYKKTFNRLPSGVVK